MPPAQPPTDQHLPGKFVFVELVTPDLAAAETFYGGLFGWTFRDVQVGTFRYAEATLDHRSVAGMIDRPIASGERRQPAWLSFVSVTSVDAVYASAVQNGARSLSAPHDVAGRGRIAVLADPQGAVFALMSSASGDPPDELPDPGEWIWASLYTNNPDYEVFDAPDPGSDSHPILASGGYARASVNALPSARSHAHWLNYVRVDDASVTATRAVALGGKVLLTPRDDRHGGKVAIVADPQGAPFGLLEWPDERSKKVLP
jgi:predicted enzyme related to lactoylglutathione lyase